MKEHIFWGRSKAFRELENYNKYVFFNQLSRVNFTAHVY